MGKVAISSKLNKKTTFIDKDGKPVERLFGQRFQTPKPKEEPKK